MLFACYHLHEPWVIPQTFLVDTFAEALPSRRWRSALIGIAVHSGQTVFFIVIALVLVSALSIAALGSGTPGSVSSSLPARAADGVVPQGAAGPMPRAIARSRVARQMVRVRDLRGASYQPRVGGERTYTGTRLPAPGSRLPTLQDPGA